MVPQQISEATVRFLCQTLCAQRIGFEADGTGDLLGVIRVPLGEFLRSSEGTRRVAGCEQCASAS